MSRSDKFEDQYEGTFSEPTYEEIRNCLILIFYTKQVNQQLAYQ
jgi:hypothetical protein